jgi:hypothetical protein
MSQPILRTVTRRCGNTTLAIPKAVSAHSTHTLQKRLFHPSQPISKERNNTAPVPPDPAKNPTVGLAPKRSEPIGQKRLADFDLSGKVFIVTGGARGLGLALAEALVETGGKGELDMSSHHIEFPLEYI